jgi:hypothetical protein
VKVFGAERAAYLGEFHRMMGPETDRGLLRNYAKDSITGDLEAYSLASSLRLIRSPGAPL